MNILTSNLNRITALLFIVFALFVLFKTESVSAQTIDADPTTVFVNVGEQGSTTITWDASPAENANVSYTINGANETPFATGTTGTQVANFIESVNTYEFLLRNANNNSLLDSVTVEGKIPMVLKPSGDVPLTIKSFYENFEATAEGTFLDLKFSTLRSCLPVVRVSEKNPGNIALISNNDFEVFNNSDVAAFGFAQKGTNHFARLGNLKPATVYHYVITSYDKQTKKWYRKKGIFITKIRTVEVKFTKIKVIDDSDDLSDGEFVFAFYLDKDIVKTVSKHIGSGKTFNVNSTKTITTQSNNLRIDVVGYDDDETEWPGQLLTCGKLPPPHPVSPSEGESDCSEWTTAKRSFSLLSGAAYLPQGDYPEEFTKSFKINAFPKGDDSEVKFRVHGKYTVTYKPVKFF